MALTQVLIDLGAGILHYFPFPELISRAIFAKSFAVYGVTSLLYMTSCIDFI